MVSITQKKIKGNIYYYLSYSYREGGKVRLIEKSLGREVPLDLSSFKEGLILEIFSKRWLKSIQKIKDGYDTSIEELGSFPRNKLLREFGVRFTYDTNKIEGSTLTLRETACAIDEKDIPINKPTKDINEAQGHMICYEDMLSTDSGISLSLIIKWHETLFSLHPNKEDLAGIIRKDQIFISGSNFVPPPPKSVKPFLEMLFKWYNENKNNLNPVLLACLMKFRFVTIHPFLDGNGRMSRLLMNYILYKQGYPMFNISSKIKKSYYNALEKAQLGFNSDNDEMFFVGWFFKHYIDQLKKIPNTG